VRAHVLGSQGHPEPGLDLLREGTSDRPGGRGWRPPLILTDLASLIEARLYTALGRLPAAWEALSDLQSAKRLPSESAVASAWLHLAAGDPATAKTTVTPVLDGHLATPVHPFTLTEAWLVDAVARAELGDDATASTSLERALREAAPERYTQVFVDGGASVPALLARQMELGTEHASFVAKLQGVVEAHPSPGQRQPAVLS